MFKMIKEKMNSLYEFLENKFFHAYYKLYAFFSPNSYNVTQYFKGIHITENIIKNPKSLYLSLQYKFSHKVTFWNFWQIHKRWDKESYKTVCNSDIFMDSIAMQVVVRKLNGLHIKQLFLYCYMTDEAANILSEYLESNNTIEELELYNFHTRKNPKGLTEDGLRKLLSSIQHNKRISKLTLYELGLKSAHYIQVANFLQQAECINYLSLAGNKIGIYDLRILINSILPNKVIKKIDLQRCNLHDSEIQFIAESLLPNSKITHMNLSHNFQENTVAIKSFFKSLAKNSYLLELNLSNMNVRGIANLAAEAIKYNKTLTYLNLSNHYNFVPHGEDLTFDIMGYSQTQSYLCPTLQELADALIENSTLKKLDLSKNAMNAKALLDIAIVLGRLNLEWLDLSFNYERDQSFYHDSEYRTNIKLILKQLFNALKDGLSINKSLKFLGLNRVDLTDDYIDSIFNGLKQNNTLQEIEIRNNSFDISKLINFIKSGTALKKISIPEYYSYGNNTNREQIMNLVNFLSSNTAGVKLPNLEIGNTRFLHTPERRFIIEECKKAWENTLKYKKPYLLFSLKNNKGQLNDGDMLVKTGKTKPLPFLPPEICDNIRDFVYSPFKLMA